MQQVRNPVAHCLRCSENTSEDFNQISRKLAKEYANECVFPSITVKVNIRSWFYINSWWS